MSHLYRRPPHGGRGLKFNRTTLVTVRLASPSPRRAWIEMDTAFSSSRSRRSRPPHGGRGLKCQHAIYLVAISLSCLDLRVVLDR